MVTGLGPRGSLRLPSELQIPVRRSSEARACIEEPSGPKTPLMAHATTGSHPELLLRLPGLHPGMGSGYPDTHSCTRDQKKDGHFGGQKSNEFEPNVSLDIIVPHPASAFDMFEKQAHCSDESTTVRVKNTFIE